MKEIIEEWHICPYEDNIDELFESLKYCVDAYLTAGNILDIKTIINIVQDLRTFLNPQENKNLSYFTDIICDGILFEYKGIDKSSLSDLLTYIEKCKNITYGKL